MSKTREWGGIARLDMHPGAPWPLCCTILCCVLIPVSLRLHELQRTAIHMCCGAILHPAQGTHVMSCAKVGSHTKLIPAAPLDG